MERYGKKVYRYDRSFCVIFSILLIVTTRTIYGAIDAEAGWIPRWSAYTRYDFKPFDEFGDGVILFFLTTTAKRVPHTSSIDVSVIPSTSAPSSSVNAHPSVSARIPIGSCRENHVRGGEFAVVGRDGRAVLGRFDLDDSRFLLAIDTEIIDLSTENLSVHR